MRLHSSLCCGMKVVRGIFSGGATSTPNQSASAGHSCKQLQDPPYQTSKLLCSLLHRAMCRMTYCLPSEATAGARWTPWMRRGVDGRCCLLDSFCSAAMSVAFIALPVLATAADG